MLVDLVHLSHIGQRKDINMRYYNKITKNEEFAINSKDVVELPDDNPFFSPLPSGKRLTYDYRGVPDGLEDIPPIQPTILKEHNENSLWSKYRAYQEQYMTDDLSSMYYVERLTSPKAQANIDWKDNVWTQYYLDKDSENYTPDLQTLGKPPHSYLEIRAEVEGS